MQLQIETNPNESVRNRIFEGFTHVLFFLLPML